MSLEILFLHTNFPAQFKHHIAFHHARGDNITFLCFTNYGRSLPGVNLLKIKNNGLKTCNKSAVSEVDKMLSTSESFYSAFKVLHESGYTPDLVVGHSGWGCASKLRCVWPDIFFIAYHEWWFWDNDGLLPDNVVTQTKWMSAPFAKQKGASSRNSLMALELANSNRIISPTFWQKSLLPSQFRNSCTVCFDGVDTDFFKPNPTHKTSSKKKLIITYGTRGMEPMRGFPDFIEAVKTILQVRSDFIVKIAGNDESCYLKSLPPHSNAWGEWAKIELMPWIKSGQVEFTGRLDARNYLEFLQMSDIHCYLSVDFVTSWSFFEALACGCSILSWDTKSLAYDMRNSGYARHTVAACSHNELVKGLETLLDNNLYRQQISKEARELSREYSLTKFNNLWNNILSEAL